MVLRLIAVLVALAWLGVANACDVCACTTANSLGMQLLQKNKSYLGIGYQSFQLNTALENKYKVRQTSLNAGIAIKDKWMIAAIVPFQFQRLKSIETTTRNIGLSDAILIVRYQILSKSNQQVAHYLFASTGIELPTGQHRNQNVVAPLGSGSFDFILNGNYMLEGQNMGLQTNLQSKINTANQSHFRYGHQVNGHLNYFLLQQKKKAVWKPFIGLMFEHLGRNKSNGFWRYQSGGQALFANLGLQCTINNSIGLEMQSNVPLAQNYKSIEGDLTSAMRFNIQINYQFKKQNK